MKLLRMNKFMNLSIYETHSNGWGANNIIRWSYCCHWKAIAHILQVFSIHLLRGG